MAIGDGAAASESPVPQADAVRRINALLGLARSAREERVEDVLRTVAETVRAAAGFGCVAVNLYRPAWDDYTAVLVLGPEEVRTAILGNTIDRAVLDRQLYEGGYERLDGVFFIVGDAAIWEDLEFAFVPDFQPVDGPDAWQPEDGLLVRLTDSADRPLGVLSVDQPASGRRPGNADLQLLRAICSHAEQALESAQQVRHAADYERMLAALLGVSATLATLASVEALLDAVAATVVAELGFHRVALYLSDGGRRLELTAAHGWSSRGEADGSPPAAGVLAHGLDVDAVEELLGRQPEPSGCWLVPARDLDRFRPTGWASPRNGRGPSAWQDHCLVVPLRGPDGTLRAVATIEDPVDRLLPTGFRRRAIRLLADQAASALEIITQRARLNYLADHDPLTGVRNRRSLPERIAGFEEVALVACDLDHFKVVNDTYGHHVGDQVLQAFGQLLRDVAREGDILVRLGGEEFCLVLPDTDARGALALAERLRNETSKRLREVVDLDITLSVGIAATSDGQRPSQLLSEADRALYLAKNAGRDRTVTATDGGMHGAPG